jgi:hypothetical protein
MQRQKLIQSDEITLLVGVICKPFMGKDWGDGKRKEAISASGKSLQPAQAKSHLAVRLSDDFPPRQYRGWEALCW